MDVVVVMMFWLFSDGICIHYQIRYVHAGPWHDHPQVHQQVPRPFSQTINYGNLSVTSVGFYLPEVVKQKSLKVELKFFQALQISLDREGQRGKAA